MIVNVGFSRADAALIAKAQEEMGLSDEAFVLAAIRLYQSVHVRVMRGERMAWLDAAGNLIREDVGGCMADD